MRGEDLSSIIDFVMIKGGYFQDVAGCSFSSTIVQIRFFIFPPFWVFRSPPLLKLVKVEYQSFLERSVFHDIDPDFLAMFLKRMDRGGGLGLGFFFFF